MHYIALLTLVSFTAWGTPCAAGPAAQTETPTIFSVRVTPSNATVTINGHKTTSTGEYREYSMKPTEGFHSSTFTVAWPDGTTESKIITFEKGTRTRIEFNKTAVEKKMPVPKEEARTKDNFGINPDWLDHQKYCTEEVYSFKGRRITRDTFETMIGASGPVDDSQKLRITFQGDKEFGKKAMGDFSFAAPLAPYRDGYLAAAYEPNSWQMKDVGIPSDFVVFVQDPTGKTLHAQKDYDGPAGLAVALDKIGTLRKPRSDFDASKVPDLRKSEPIPTPPLPTPLPLPNAPTGWNWNLLFLFAALGALLIYVWKQKGPQHA